MRTLKHGFGIGGALLAVVGVLTWTGCEEGPDTSAINTYFDRHAAPSGVFTDLATSPLQIVPVSSSSSASSSSSSSTSSQSTGPSVTTTRDGETVLVMAVGGTSPYRWSVTDVAVGDIVAQGGNAAVYQRNGPGGNVIIVRDSKGNKAFCTVNESTTATTTP